MAQEDWLAASRNAWLPGLVAGLASASVLAWRGHREAGDAAGPLNGPSQWLWGRHAPSVRGFSARHTLVGFAIHVGAAGFWAVLFERLRPRMGVVPAAVTTSAIANVVDYQLTPPRLQPGYERRLSRTSLAWAYGAVALGFAAGAMLRRRS